MSDRIPTLADVCNAIAEGHIPVAVDGPMYQVNALELRRYFTKLRPLPAISTTSDPLSPSSHTDSSAWSTSATTSVA